jgi:hypothetical protein
VKALRPGNSVDVKFDDVAFLIRQSAADLVVVRENPGTRGGLTPSEREALPTSAFALPGRRFPINDANHGRIALQYILAGRVSEGDVNTVVQAVLQRWGRNREVMDFYNKHKANLTRQNVERIHGRRMSANPAGEVYDPAKEQFRSVVQGVYESLVRRELKKGYNAPFVSANPKRLDAKLTAEKRRLLLSSAYAIATRQGQKHGWLEYGTQTPTEKGIQRSAERLFDPEQRKHAEENRQDYERTLAAVRKSGHFRVVAEVVNGQKRYVVEPRPSRDLIQIPEYRMSSVNAQEDADRAEAAFRAAAPALKAKQNPRKGETKEVIVGEGIEVGRETLGTLAKKLEVSVGELLYHGRVLVPKIDKDTKKQSWVELPPRRLAKVAVGPYLSVLPAAQLTGATPVDPKLEGARVSIAPPAVRSDVSYLPKGTSAAYFKEERTPVTAYTSDKPLPPNYPTPVEEFRAGTPLPENYVLIDKELTLGVRELAGVPLGGRDFKPISYRARRLSADEQKEQAQKRTKAEQAAAEEAQRAARTMPGAGKAPVHLKPPTRSMPPDNALDYARTALKPGGVLVVDEGREGVPAFAYYAPKTAPVDQSAVYEFLRRSVYGNRVKTFADDPNDYQIIVWGNADEAFDAYEAAAQDDPATFERVRDILTAARRRSDDQRAAETVEKQQKFEQERKYIEAKGSMRDTTLTPEQAAARRKQAILTLGGAPGKGGRKAAAQKAGVGIRVSPEEERRYAYETFSAPLSSAAPAVDDAAFQKMIRKRETELARAFKEKSGENKIPLTERARIQKQAVKDVEIGLGQLGIAPNEVANLAAVFEEAIHENRDLFIKQVVAPAVDASQAKKSVTTDIRPEKALLGEEKDFLTTFWDVEYVPGAEGKLEARYVLYIPQYQTYVAREKRVLGRTVVQPETGFIKPRKKSGKVGPKSPRQPGGDTYLKEDENLNTLLSDLGAANRSGDFIRATEIENKLAALRQQENAIRGARMLQAYASKREKAENIPVLKKLSRFNLPSSADESDIYGATLTIGAAPTEDNGWVEDLAFTMQMRGQKMAARMKGQKVADPRYGFMKFVTTNPLLAFYTIMLWHTPEMFTGFSITLPAPVYVGGQEEFEVVNLPPVSDPRNVHNSPLFGYYMGVAAEVLMQGALVNAVSKQDFDTAARIYLNLYGTSDIVGAKDKGLRGALRDITRKVRPLERLPRTEADEAANEAKATLKLLNTVRARKAQQGQDTAGLDADIAKTSAIWNQTTSGATFDQTALAGIMTSQRGPSEAQNIVLEAWQRIREKGAWAKVLGVPSTTKLLTNGRRYR